MKRKPTKKQLDALAEGRKPVQAKGHAPTNLIGNFKHGINSKSFKPCLKCEEKDNCERRGDLIINKIDRCMVEKEMADYIFNTFNEEFNLTKSEQLQLLWVVNTMIRNIRASNYITEHGLVQKQFIKDEKTGKIYTNIISNCLDKSMYYLDRNVREWLSELKLSRKSQEEKRSPGTDVALYFSNLKKQSEN